MFIFGQHSTLARAIYREFPSEGARKVRIHQLPGMAGKPELVGAVRTEVLTRDLALVYVIGGLGLIAPTFDLLWGCKLDK